MKIPIKSPDNWLNQSLIYDDFVANFLFFRKHFDAILYEFVPIRGATAAASNVGTMSGMCDVDT